MITDYYKKKVETSISERAHKFEVKDPAFIFSLLCNSMYSKPLITCVQEYICNARDSHREAGCENVPLKIVLPTEVEPTLLIQDFGVGLSRDRVANVFVLLGESTKRDTNHQTGGFGIGAKSGWAYTSSFGVTTVHDGDRRIYVAFLGENGVGNLDMVDESKSDEPNGTTISLPIQVEDISACIEAVHRVMATWEVKPVIKPRSIAAKLTPYETNSRGTGWRYVKNFPMYSNEVLIVVDGIPYPCPDEAAVNGFRLTNNHCMLLEFETGILDLTSNREAIKANDRTYDLIKERTKEILGVAGSQVKSGLRGIKNFNRFEHRSAMLKKKWSFLRQDMLFNGVAIVKKKNDDGRITYNFQGLPVKIDTYHYNKWGEITKSQSQVTKFKFDPSYFVVVNDKFVKNIPKAKLKAFMLAKFQMRNTPEDDRFGNKLRVITPLLEHGIMPSRKSRYSWNNRAHFNYPNSDSGSSATFEKDEFIPVFDDLKKLNFTMYSSLKSTRTKSKGRIQAITHTLIDGRKENTFYEQDELTETSSDFVYLSKDDDWKLARTKRGLNRMRRFFPDAELPSAILIKHTRNGKRILATGVVEADAFLKGMIPSIRAQIGYDEWFYSTRVHWGLAFKPKDLTDLKLELLDPNWIDLIRIHETHCENVKSIESTSAMKAYEFFYNSGYVRRPKRLQQHAKNIADKQEILASETITKFSNNYALLDRFRPYNTKPSVLRELILYLNCSYITRTRSKK